MHCSFIVLALKRPLALCNSGGMPANTNKWTPDRLSRLLVAAGTDSFGRLTKEAYEKEFKEFRGVGFKGAKLRLWKYKSELKKVLSASVQVQSDVNDTVCTVGLGGVWCDRPYTGLDNVHSDTVRATEVRRIIHPHKVVCLQNGRLAVQSTGSLCVDFREKRGWYRQCLDGTADPETITGRGVSIFILDYFWLPRIYYEKNSAQNGYGGMWFSKLLRFFF